MKKLLILLTYIVLFTARISFGAELDYLEQRNGNFLMHVVTGPSESSSIGSYSVHIYRDENHFIAGLVRPRDGSLMRAWMVNIDSDDDIEILIWTRVVGSGSYGELEIFKFDGVNIQPAQLPIPDDNLLKDYRGRDIFGLKDGIILRSFPLYLSGDGNCCPKGGTRTLELDILENKWKLSNKQINP